MIKLKVKSSREKQTVKIHQQTIFCVKTFENLKLISYNKSDRNCQLARRI